MRNQSQRGAKPIIPVLIGIHVIAALTLIMFILLHAGRGGGLSEMFGGGMSGGLSGTTGVEKNLDRLTIAVALVFAATTLALVLLLD